MKDINLTFYIQVHLGDIVWGLRYGQRTPAKVTLYFVYNASFPILDC